MFQGDVANFSPADLLTFLAHLNKEGVLTVRRGQETISLSFRRGSLVDAHDESVDRMLLRMLRQQGRTSEKVLAYLERAKRETGLPLRQILESVEWLSIPNLAQVLGDGLRETVFNLFLMEGGEFRFAEIAVDPNPYLPALDCGQLTMDTARLVDEHREALRRLGEERAPQPTVAGRAAAPAGAPMRWLLEQADGRRTVRQLLQRRCQPARAMVATLAAAVGQGWLEMVAAASLPQETPRAVTRDDAFPAYRRALRRMLLADGARARLGILVDHCRARCQRTVLLRVRQGEVVAARGWPSGGARASTPTGRPSAPVRLDLDPIFQKVAASRLAFCGKVFPSALLQALGLQPPDGDCALVPLCASGETDLLLYAATADAAGALPYLELLAWHLQPPAPEPADAARQAGTGAEAAAERAEAPDPAGPGATSGANGTATRGGADPDDEAAEADEAGGDAGTDPVQRMVAAITELPPMPHIVTRILELLADPDCRITALMEVLSQDPALVARLVKVGNSALYGGGRKAGSLNQAIVRMGLRTTRSLVVAASTRSLFPMDSTRVGLWGKALWQHSVECGIASRRVAQTVGGADPDEAFVCGVLHDLGKVIILLNQPEQYRKVQQLQEVAGLDSLAAETRILGFDHARVGARLLEQWSMPPALVEGVRRHHDPGDDPLSRLVACGDELSHTAAAAVAIGAEAEAGSCLPAPRAAALGIADGALAELRAAVTADFGECDLFD